MKAVQKLRLFQQEQSGSCGPTSLRMALTCFDIFLSEEELVARCQTWLGILDSIYFGGTTQENLIAAIRKLGCFLNSKVNAEWYDLVVYSKLGVPTIVGWMSDRDWDGSDCHYSVVLRATEDWIRLADPQFGDVWTCSRGHFERKWLFFEQGGSVTRHFLVALD